MIRKILGRQDPRAASPLTITSRRWLETAWLAGGYTTASERQWAQRHHLIRLKTEGSVIKAEGCPLAGDADFDIAEGLPGGMEQGVAGNKKREREGSSFPWSVQNMVPVSWERQCPYFWQQAICVRAGRNQWKPGRLREMIESCHFLTTCEKGKRKFPTGEKVPPYHLLNVSQQPREEGGCDAYSASG